MFNYNYCEIEELATHHVGNKNNEGKLQLSNTTLAPNDEGLKELLLRYFLKPFAAHELYNFTFSGGDFQMNPVFKYCESIFQDSIPFLENSIKIAQYLFDLSIHPNIKPGDLFVVRFSNLKLNDETVEAIGIFKAENAHPFLLVENEDEDPNIYAVNGINVDKLDKGCIIFNQGRNDGYKVAIVDKANKEEEAKYWKDNFLKLKPCSDEFYHTKTFLNIAKTYVTEKMGEDFEMGKTDKIDILNRSVEYFKTNESFNKVDFEETVFQNEDVINSFRSYNSSYRESNEIEVKDEFDISDQAVKKQSKFFKSILKLDKNFHVYIHGNKDMIERGVESDGRKFYKIYFEKED